MVTHTSRVTFLLLKTSLKESSSKNPKPDSYCLKEAIPEPIHETPGPDPSSMSLLGSEDGSWPSETPLPDHRRVVDAQKQTESSGGRTADELRILSDSDMQSRPAQSTKQVAPLVSELPLWRNKNRKVSYTHRGSKVTRFIPYKSQERVGEKGQTEGRSSVPGQERELFMGSTLSCCFKRCSEKSKAGTRGENPQLWSLPKCPDLGCEQGCHTAKCLGSNSKQLSSHHTLLVLTLTNSETRACFQRLAPPSSSSASQ